MSSVEYPTLYIGLLGDVHGKFDVIFEIIKRHPEVKRWFQVGDLGGELDIYPLFPSNFHFIQGNHENWDYIQKLKETNNPTFLSNGNLKLYGYLYERYCVGVLGGNYSSNQYKNKTSSLLGNRRRHFTIEEYENLIDQRKSIENLVNFDILITHEAPSPYVKSVRDIGIPLISDLIKNLKPHIHFFGHHHRYTEQYVGGVLSVGLDFAYKSYVLYDTIGKTIKKIDI